MTDTATRHIEGLRQIASSYDGYLVDLWGTVHNGVAPLPGAPECLAALKAAGKKVCLLSNAPRRVRSVTARLDEMGVPRSSYDHAMSSGEATHLALRDRTDPWHAALGARCFHLGPPRDNDVREDTGLEMVPSVEKADFVLATGIDDYADPIEKYEGVLAEAAARRLPMICANPDLVVIVGEQMSICAGMFAKRYEELGGEVFYHGKPHPSVYRTCLELLDLPPERVLGIGDSLRTDIAGAAAAGLDSLLLLDGIHGEEIAAMPGASLDERLQAMARREGASPTYAAGKMVW
ncbi:HAD superfamily hydrolase (TIGR01459 family) [Constrictibacter sp. MBR-5]|jgi:HAD superfamily hydrolase (TIGR01459 family)|uniref:TIGR01459 family HAD-type hydrolase n=1 Tax=Constrictibacter sp. MBR-5 TaxID=3156467 RepID=UPI00339A5F0C